MDGQPGQLLSGRYELQKLLGAGGLGRVFQARDARIEREVAVKLFDRERVPADALDRYLATIRQAARVKHPAVVVPREAPSGAGPLFVVGELLRGEDLDAHRRRVGPLPWQQALAIAERCAEALVDLSHATGKAHRALKPGNVIVGAEGEVWLLDFGIAELGVQPVPPREPELVVEYRAPEQVEGAPGDARSDVYSLGVLLFEMATGVHPFAGSSVFKVQHRVLLQPLPDASQLAPEAPLPRHLEDLLARALARRPEERFTDAGQLAKLLAMVRSAPGPLRDARGAVKAATTGDETTGAGGPEVQFEDRTTAVGRAGGASPAPVVPDPATERERADTTFRELREPAPETTERLPAVRDRPATAPGPAHVGPGDSTALLPVRPGPAAPGQADEVTPFVERGAPPLLSSAMVPRHRRRGRAPADAQGGPELERAGQPREDGELDGSADELAGDLSTAVRMVLRWLAVGVALGVALLLAWRWLAPPM